MALLSKNQRRGRDNSQKFFCPCGGEIKMGGKMVKAKMRWSATCTECGTNKRKPSDF